MDDNRVTQENEEVDIPIHFKKVSAKTALAFFIGWIIIFFLTESQQLKIGMAILGALFVLGSLCGGSTKEVTEDKKNEGDTPVENKPPAEEPVKKDIRKPKMPERTEEKTPAPKVETTQEDMSNDDWADFFASLDNNEGDK